jgi:hypothetical protein
MAGARGRADRAREAAGLDALEERREAGWEAVEQIADRLTNTEARTPAGIAAKLAIVVTSMRGEAAIDERTSDGRLLVFALTDAQRLATS